MAHPNKDIRKAIEFAAENGWSYEEGGKSHKKGILRCPGNSPECRYFVYGTPQNPGNVAKAIRRNVNRCGHEVN